MTYSLDSRTVRGAWLVFTTALALLALAAPAHATFPGANGKIAFQNYASIDTVNPDGTGDTTIAQYGYDPAWSADGTRIAYYSGGDVAGKITVANADGSGARVIGPAGDGYSVNSYAADPAWSPDGRIAYLSAHVECVSTYECDYATDGIWVMNSDGSGDHLLTTHGGDVFRGKVAWSPDGTKIAFSEQSATSYRPDIYVMNADGTGITNLTRTDNSWEEQPSWSPDATKVTYMRWEGSQEIWAMNADGSGQTGLTDPSTNSIDPSWSPDGTKITFERDYGRIVVMDASGAHQTEIACCSAEDPDWQPIPNRPPDCSNVAASRPVLTTPNHRLVPMVLDGATDPDGDPVTLTVDGVTQDEPVVGSGDNTSPDAVDQGGGQVRIRAERNPHGDGRVYRIAFTATDGRGGSCSGTAKVSVPRKKRKSAIDSAPPSYDSFVR